MFGKTEPSMPWLALALPVPLLKPYAYLSTSFAPIKKGVANANSAENQRDNPRLGEQAQS